MKAIFVFKTQALPQRINVVLSLFLFILFTGTAKSTEPPNFITIGTGSATGIYYPAGNAICKAVNRSRKQHGVYCSVELTKGSVSNLNSVGKGELDFALAQSDTQYHAYRGTDMFSELGANTNLRSLFALHSEMFTVIARQDANINSFEDLIDKRVNIGEPGTGQRATMHALMNAYGWNEDNFQSVRGIDTAKLPEALCNNTIDAYILSVGHPAGSVKQAANSCDVVLVPIKGSIVDSLVHQNSYFSKSIIPGGMYRGSTKDVPTFSVNTSIIASADINNEIIYSVVKSVFDHLETFKKLHPAFSTLDTHAMINNENMPMHSGAIKYFKEVGLK